MKDYTQPVAPQHNFQNSIDIPPVQPIYINSGGTAVVIVVMFMFSVIVLGAVYRDSDSAITGIVASVPVFLIGTPILILAVNGGITHMFCARLEQVTIRRYNDSMTALQLDTGEQGRAFTVEPVQSSLLTAEGLQGGNTSPRYVPAIARAKDELKVAAAGWVAQLFDGETGRPLPNRITKARGNIQLKSPETEVTVYLCSLGIISQDEGKHLFYNTALYPTLRQAINAIGTGVRPSSTDGGVGGWEGGS